MKPEHRRFWRGYWGRWMENKLNEMEGQNDALLETLGISEKDMSEAREYLDFAAEVVGNKAACPNCGRFAWVHLPDTSESVLWACPCGEFRWTSYADWEVREHGRFAGDDNVTEGHAVTVGPKFPRGSRLDEKLEGKPQWAERAREPGDIPAEP